MEQAGIRTPDPILKGGEQNVFWRDGCGLCIKGRPVRKSKKQRSEKAKNEENNCKSFCNLLGFATFCGFIPEKMCRCARTLKRRLRYSLHRTKTTIMIGVKIKRMVNNISYQVIYIHPLYLFGCWKTNTALLFYHNETILSSPFKFS